MSLSKPLKHPYPGKHSRMKFERSCGRASNTLCEENFTYQLFQDAEYEYLEEMRQIDYHNYMQEQTEIIKMLMSKEYHVPVPSRVKFLSTNDLISNEVSNKRLKQEYSENYSKKKNEILSSSVFEGEDEGSIDTVHPSQTKQDY